MKECKVGSSTIYDITAQKEHPFKIFAESESENTAVKQKIQAKQELEQLDNTLYEWFKLKWSEGELISGLTFTEYALRLLKLLLL